MNESINHTWDILSKKLPAGDRLTAKKIHTELTDKIYCAVNVEGQRHLLIILNTEDEELTDNQSRGLSILTRHLNITDGEPCKYIDIVCNDPNGYSAFNLLAEEIASALGDGSLSPSVATSRVLDKWRRFWSRLARRHLNRAEQIGLFAELWFLSEWLIPKQGAEAVHSWQGPFGHKKDFENDNFCVEVKATTSRRGRIFHINSIEQMEDIENGTLYFFGARLAETKARGQSIPALVSLIKEKLVDQYRALDYLEEGLINVGYSDIHAEEYEKMKLQVREGCLFEVKDDFPRLSENTIQMPPGVERIEYEINLDAFNHLIVSKDSFERTP